MYRRYGKRLLDLGLASVLLVLLAPFMALVGLMVRLKLGSPILFRQRRPGLMGAPFTMYKFRSMAQKRDEEESLLSDSERLTRFGLLLRSTSLDEVPEIFNVFKGEMSLVGPRPLLMRYLDRYTPEQMRRHEIRPGITGWAQVNGRNAISWEEKFALDQWYVDNFSFWLDLRILLLTVLITVRRQGISQSGETTKHEFTGTRT